MCIIKILFLNTFSILCDGDYYQNSIRLQNSKVLNYKRLECITKIRLQNSKHKSS